MEFDREALEALLNQKLERAEKSIVRNYLTKCGVSGDDVIAMTDEFISERAQHSATAAAAELECARQTIAELEGRVREQEIDFVVRDAMLNAGVKSEHYADVRKLAAEGINSALNDEGQIDTDAVNSAVAEVIARIPMFVGEIQNNNVSGFTGSRGNFARNDDSASVLKNRLNSARAAGNNALSVSIISEAAEMGISLR